MIINSIISGSGGLTASIFVTGLSETDTVTATKDGKSYSGKWVSKPNPACIVPDGYTQLDYIESSGTQYINTGIRLESNYVIDMDISINSGNSDRWLFGADNYSNNRYGVNSLNDTSIQAIFCANSWTSSTSITVGERFNIEYKLGSQQTCSKDGAVFGTKTNTINKSSLDLYIFSDNINNTVTSPSKIKAYTFKCYSDLEKSTIIMNLVPCKRTSDNAIGMYDLVTNTFFANSGTGTFVAGTEVPQTIGGFLIDNIKSYGTYTITATDGTNTATQDVLVDMATQYDVEMTLSGKLYLYNLGDECEDVTGGLDDAAHCGYNSTYPWTRNPTKNASNLEFAYGGYKDCCTIVTKNEINFSDYKCLNFEALVGDSKFSGTIDTSSIGSGYLLICRINSDGSKSTTDIAIISAKKQYFQDAVLAATHINGADGILHTSTDYITKIWLE